MTNEEVIKLIQAEADRRRTNAGFAGEMGDRGASQLEREILAWKAGLAGEIPAIPSWRSVIQRADPDEQLD